MLVAVASSIFSTITSLCVNASNPSLFMHVAILAFCKHRRTYINTTRSQEHSETITQAILVEFDAALKYYCLHQKLKSELRGSKFGPNAYPSNNKNKGTIQKSQFYDSTTRLETRPLLVSRTFVGKDFRWSGGGGWGWQSKC